MTWWDWVVGAVVLWSLAKGFWQGLIKEVFSLLAWILGLVLASDLAQSLPMPDTSDGLKNLLSFVLIFVCVSLVSALIARILSQMVHAIGLGLINRLLGGFFGLFKCALLLFLITLVVTSTPLQEMDFWQNSVVANLLEQAFGAVKQMSPIDLGKYVT
jgi:membrane protein required for colicin V production